MPFDSKELEDGTHEAIVRDAVGNYVDCSLVINRGILSIVLRTDDVSIGPSAEIDIDDFKEALAYLEERQ